MRRIIENTYKIKNPTKENLLRLGFQYNKDTELYTYHFPVIKYKQVATLKCCITVKEEIGKIKIDVYRTDGEGYYSPFYGVVYGKYDSILKKINEVILKEFKRLDVREVKK